MFFSKPKTVAAAIASLTKAVEDLNLVSAEQDAVAAQKANAAEVLHTEALAAQDEAIRARKVAAKLREITEAE